MSIYHDPGKGERPFVLPCSLFGGVSPRTGMRVWSRHRWEQGSGKGRCVFCGRFKSDVMSTPKPTEVSQ